MSAADVTVLVLLMIGAPVVALHMILRGRGDL